MREIRFRAWQAGKMYYLRSEKDQFNHYLQVGSGGFWLYNSEGERIAASEDDGELMQYTGLKDKNGKEIYEGDILKTPAAVIKDAFNYTYVEYRTEIATYVKRTHDTRAFVRLEIRIDEVEVIGNLFEHSHLLTT